MDLDLRKLRYFLTVAEELHYGRAAERLHIAQPVLSRQITQLERELGVTLFLRSTRGTELSDAGVQSLDHARAVLGQARNLQRKARVAARGKVHFSIGFMPGVIVTDLVAALTERFPDLHVDVVRTGWDDQIEVVRDGRVDVSIVRLPVPTNDVTVVPLYDEPRWAVLPAAHPLAEQPVITLDDLAMLDLLQPPAFHPDWRDAAAARRPDALTTAREDLPHVATVEEKLEHVAQGRGFVILPSSARQFYTRPGIVHREVEGLGPVTSGIAYPQWRTSPTIAACVRIARRLLDAPPGVPTEAARSAHLTAVATPPA